MFLWEIQVREDIIKVKVEPALNGQIYAFIWSKEYQGAKDYLLDSLDDLVKIIGPQK